MNLSEGSFNERNFIDRIQVEMKSGNGGSGCLSFVRNRMVKTGGADGGGGRAGSKG